jgi:hypothetical protein
MSQYTPPGTTRPTPVPALVTDPATPILGQMWHNTTDGLTKIYTAAGTLTITTGAPPGGISIETVVHQGGASVAQISQSITHAAAAMILVCVSQRYLITSVTVGGVAAALLGAPSSAQPAFYWIVRAGAATETITVTFSAPQNYPAFIALSLLGSAAQLFEGTAYANGASPLANTIAAGTAGRRVIHMCTAVALGGFPTLTLDAALTLVDSVDSGPGASNYGRTRVGFQDEGGAGATYTDTFAGTGSAGRSGSTGLRP